MDTSIPLSEAVAPLLNKRGPISITRDPINETAIRYYCEVVEDGNPLYWDEEFAKGSEYGRVIAPPQALFSMTFQPFWTPDFVKQKTAADVKAVNGGDTEAAGPNAMSVVREYGYATATVVGSQMEYLEPFGPGDGRILSQGMTTDVSAPKKTRVGEGVFVTSVTEYRTEVGQRLVGRQTMTLMLYNADGPKKG